MSNKYYCATSIYLLLLLVLKQWLSLLDAFCVVDDDENKSLNGSKRFIFWFDEDFGSVLRIFVVVVAWIGAGKITSDAFRCNIGLSNGIELKSTPSKSVVSAEKFDWKLICKLNKSYLVSVNTGSDGGGFVSSPVMSRRVPTAMSSLGCVSSFNGEGFDSACCCCSCIWLGVGDKRRAGWGDDGLLTLEVGWSMLSLGERRGAGDSDVYVPRYWWPSPN